MITQLLQSISTRANGTNGDGTMTAVLVSDLETATRIRAEREASDAGRYDEVWEGVYVVSPIANTLHQRLVVQLILAFQNVLDLAGSDRMYGGVNVSDREEGWVQNYRVPDLAVVLSGNRLKDCDTHLCGGPDFLVEILSPNDLAREKRGFYAQVGVRELLIVARAPWALELYRLDAGRLDLVGTSTPDRQDALTSTVLPLSFRLVPDAGRPRIGVSRTVGEQSWLI
jgi:Uma2 family endonuclease